ncbi:class I SAM-dependent methyltransferase [Ferrimonas balearica]|uniref:class I SAM-dependent methyltransferase n=1 Tax=Ferrimonas balearica TaxID=44012 RepID=UPI001C996EC4|nr:methyltransferase [Ferrimonas balearica]MBY5920596.1 methyltransferase [Ferrimonas balearica]MBY5996719.1 methyltransferase [Ferrimonas balearica]
MTKTLIPMAFLAATLSIPVAAESAPTLTDLAEGSHRSEANVARNLYRHPVETLEFFGLHPHMRVIELWPGGGWYSEILAPYLKGQGNFVAASFDLNPPAEANAPAYRARIGKSYQEKLAADPDLYGQVEVIAFDPPRQSSLGIEATADMVLTFRNLHNWAKDGQLETVFRSAWEVLTPGGVFGVVEHRGKPGQDIASGYMDEAEVIALAEKVGFRLAAKSEINANAKDSKDHPKGVWTLPPSLRLGEQDRAKYLAIGESDRMTLKFYKPEI